jgi:predicted HTH transcriptional regulator
MKPPASPNYAQEFKELTGEVTEAMEEMADPVNQGLMLFTIAEEKKSNNLVVKDINSKFDQILSKLDRIATLMEEQVQNREESGLHSISDRDEEIIEFIREKKKVCADDLQDHFNYKGRNAASARLNKLFRDKLVEKIPAGKTVYYMMRNPSHD